MNLFVVALFALAFGAIAFLMSRFGGGRSSNTDSTRFPYDTGSTIPPPSWSPDSGSSDNTQCEVSDSGWGDSGWGDSGSDFGSCDNGGSDGGGGGD